MVTAAIRTVRSVTFERGSNVVQCRSSRHRLFPNDSTQGEMHSNEAGQSVNCGKPVPSKPQTTPVAPSLQPATETPRTAPFQPFRLFPNFASEAEQSGTNANCGKPVPSKPQTTPVAPSLQPATETPRTAPFQPFRLFPNFASEAEQSGTNANCGIPVPSRPPMTPVAPSLQPATKKPRTDPIEAFRLFPNVPTEVHSNGAGQSVMNVEEILAVQQQIQLMTLAAENERMKMQMEALKGQIFTQEAGTQTTNNQVLNVESLRGKKKGGILYYTGLSEEQFGYFFNFFVPKQELPFTPSKRMSSVANMLLVDQFLLVMAKLRQNFDFEHIGMMGAISAQDASTLFSDWIVYMYYRCGEISIWPHRDQIIAHMPANYKEEFPNTLAIIDGTELKIKRPSSLRRQSQVYSEYKSATTLKGLIGIDPRGSVIFTSMLFTGAISDKELTRRSGFLKLMNDLIENGKILKGDGIMADKGFRIAEEIANLGLRLNIPPFARSGTQMSTPNIDVTDTIATHRVHVERAIARVKKFKILTNAIDLTFISIINQIWTVCCFATNFMGFLILDHDSTTDDDELE